MGLVGKVRRNPTARFWVKRQSSFLLLPFFLLGVWFPAWGEVSGLFEEGRRAFQAGFYSEAVGTLERFLRERPEDSQGGTTLFMIGVARVHLEEFGEALEAFRFLEARYPDSPYLEALPYWRGIVSLKRGKEREALLSFEKILPRKNDLNWKSAAYIAARLYETQGHLSEAAALYRKLSDLPEVGKERQAEVLFRLGSIAFEERNFDEAYQIYTKLVLEFHENPLAEEALYFSGEALFNLKNYQKAEAQFLSFLSFYGESSLLEPALYRLGIIYEKLGHRKKAVGALDELVKKFPRGKMAFNALRRLPGLLFQVGEYQRSRTLYSELLKRDPPPEERQKILFNRARSEAKLALYTAAMDSFKKAATGPDPQVTLHSLYQARQAALLKGDERNQQFFEELLFDQKKDNPFRQEIGASLLESYEKQGKKEQWSQVLQSLIEDYPHSPLRPSYYLLAGEHDLQEGKTEKALKMLHLAARESSDPHQTNQAYLRIAFIHSGRGEFMRAYRFYEKIIAKKTQDELYQQALFSGGLALMNAGKTLKGSRLFQKLIKEQPKTHWASEASFYLGQSYYEGKQYRRAISSFERAARRKNTRARQADIFYWKGWSYFQLKEYEQSATSFVRAAQIAPKGGESYLRAAVSRLLLKQSEKGLHLLDKALGASPTREVEVAALFRKALVLFFVGEPQKGISTVRHLKKRFPASELPGELLLRVGEHFLGKREYQSAYKWFSLIPREFSKSQKNVEAAELKKGVTLVRQKTWQKAATQLIFFLKTYRKSSHAVTASVTLAEVLDESHDPDLIENLYQKIHQSSLSEKLKAPVELSYWSRQRDSPQKEQSLRDLFEIVENASQKNRVLLELGGFYLRTKRYARAREILAGLAANSQASEQGVSAQQIVANSFEREGRLKEAVEEYVRLFYRFPDQVDAGQRALRKALSIHKKLGDRKQVRSIEKLLKKRPAKVESERG